MILNYLSVFVCSIVGALACFKLKNYLRKDVVLTSALLSFLVALVFYFMEFPTWYEEHVPRIFMGATFIGMVSEKVLSTYLGVFTAALIYGVMYVAMNDVYDGFGGFLGGIACVSILSVLAIRKTDDSKV